ncbi:MAG TPA: sensor histidine kinase [Thermoanaerobaculia bacterium]|jgi:two-component system sensor histidine kinase DesK
MTLLPKDRQLGWTPYAWLIYIVPFAATPAYQRRFDDVNGWSLFLGTTVIFSALYFLSYWRRGADLVLVALGIAVLGVTFWPISYAAGSFFVYAAAALGQLDSTKHAIRGVVMMALVPVIEGALLQLDFFNAAWPVVFALLVGAINVHYSQVGRSNARLRLAQDEIEHLAKVAERERIARDLHDLLGHTLSLVVLKSELASKLAERDVERARDEIRDVERIARDALAQVRTAVAGYRARGFESELQHARAALGTAGVILETNVTPRQLPPAHEAVLSLALREAVTNIVRHAAARHCRVTLEADGVACTLTIADDGRGGNAPFGSGLTGMRERVTVLGGTMTRDGRGGTTVRVTLPLQTPNVAERSA